MSLNIQPQKELNMSVRDYLNLMASQGMLIKEKNAVKAISNNSLVISEEGGVYDTICSINKISL